ncbi:MAG: hypothetical protein ABH829_00275 [archaeon]
MPEIKKLNPPTVDKIVTNMGKVNLAPESITAIRGVIKEQKDGADTNIVDCKGNPNMLGQK